MFRYFFWFFILWFIGIVVVGVVGFNKNKGVFKICEKIGKEMVSEVRRKVEGRKFRLFF